MEGNPETAAAEAAELLGAIAIVAEPENDAADSSVKDGGAGSNKSGSSEKNKKKKKGGTAERSDEAFAHLSPATLLSARSNAFYSRLSIAPMMDVSDRHYRYLMRLITRETLLYTEMIVDKTIIHSEHSDMFLLRNVSESPVALQLGGSDPEEMREAVAYALRHNYDELDLNCGCPSSRVSGKGCFGAALMKSPMRVAAIVRAMIEAVDDLSAQMALQENAAGTANEDASPAMGSAGDAAAACSESDSQASPSSTACASSPYCNRPAAPRIRPPVTVKCRLGVDDEDSYEHAHRFVEVVSKYGGARHFIIHARKAFLQGLNPAQNRNVPPLMYDRVFRLKQEFPHLQISLNGGVLSLDTVEELLEGGLDGVMLGRAAWHNPWIFSDADRRIFGKSNPGLSRRQVLRLYGEYMDAQRAVYKHCSKSILIKPIIPLFAGEKGNKAFRRRLNDGMHNKESPMTMLEVVEHAMAAVPDEVLDQTPP